MRSKLCTGTGDGSWNSIDFDAHGLSPAGTWANTSDQTKLTRKSSIDAPRTNAEMETHMLAPCRYPAYVTARRGIPRKPITSSGPNVELNDRNMIQKCHLPSRSFSR